MKNVKKLVVLFGTLMLFSPAFAQEEEEVEKPDLARIDRAVGMFTSSGITLLLALQSLRESDLTPELTTQAKTEFAPALMKFQDFYKNLVQHADDLRTTAAAAASAGQLKKLSAPEFDTLPDKDLYIK